MVHRFALSGASVAKTARSPLPDGQTVALFVQTNIGTALGVQDVASRIQQGRGGLDILVNMSEGSHAPNGGYPVRTYRPPLYVTARAGPR
jgi:NAD(P)-dependent dehydrogenase (short-subunit alcohol dehydrogenase family)